MFATKYMPQFAMHAMLHIALAEATVNGFLRHIGLDDRRGGLIVPPEFKRILRICNSYPDISPVHVFLGENIRLTGDKPIPYKSCQEFDTLIEEEDILTVKFANGAEGTFVISGLPKSDAILMFVVERHDVESTAVAFQSHVFAPVRTSQVAVINAFKGFANSTLQIQDMANVANPRSEQLEDDHVVAVTAGHYQVALVNAEGFTVQAGDLVALNSESYIVLISGLGAQEGKSYPQELTVFPHSDVQALKGEGFAVGVSFFCFLATSIALLRV